MSRTGCPGRAELLDFSTGNLSRAALARLAEHVERCAGCLSALEALDGRTDPLLAWLRQPVHGEDCLAVAVPPALLAAARSVRQGPPARPASTGPRRLDRFELLQEL